MNVGAIVEAVDAIKTLDGVELISVRFNDGSCTPWFERDGDWLRNTESARAANQGQVAA